MPNTIKGEKVKIKILKVNSSIAYGKVLEILEKSDYLDENISSSMLNDCLEIKRILIASINTAKDRHGSDG